MAIDLHLLKKLREETSVSIADCRNALDEAEGNYERAVELLRKRASDKAAKKADRETSQGLIETFSHQGKIGAMVMLLCETDFVARTDEFKHLAHEIAMQVVALNPATIEELLKQEYIKNNSVTIEDMLKQAIQKTGENIVLKQFVRLEL